MAIPRTNTGQRGSVGLDLDGDFLAAVVVADGRIHSALSAELPEGIMSDGEVVDSERLADVLREIFRSGALPRDVRLGVANQQIVVRQLELPRIEEDKDLAAAVRFQAAEAIAMPLNEVVLDYQRVGDGVDAEGNPRTNVIVVAARESMIARIVEAAQREGTFKPEVSPEFAAMCFYGAIEQLLSGWIFGIIPETEEEFERAKALVVETICGGLESAPAPVSG